MAQIKLILPKNGIDLDAIKKEHLYFLAGPVGGGSDWRTKAIKLLMKRDPTCYIACPCKYDKIMNYSPT